MRGITCALISLTCWYMGSHMSRVNLTIKGALAITAFWYVAVCDCIYGVWNIIETEISLKKERINI